jgi:hypothetical protein
VHALGELLPALLIPFAQPRSQAGSHYGYDRKNDDKANKTQPNQCAEKYQAAFHRYDSERIAAYASTEARN